MGNQQKHPEGIFQTHLRINRTSVRYDVLLVPPNAESAVNNGNPLFSTCRSLHYDDIEEATQALRIALKKRQYSEACDLLRASGYALDHPVTVGSATLPNDVIVLLAYQHLQDVSRPSFWASRFGGGRGKPAVGGPLLGRGPLVFYGGRSQLALDKDSDNAPIVDYSTACDTAEALFHMAEISMIG